jgi:hypothetical protein
MKKSVLVLMTAAVAGYSVTVVTRISLMASAERRWPETTFRVADSAAKLNS